MKERFIKLLKETKIDGIENFIDYLETTSFYTAPASTASSKHSAKEGGLLEHSLNVYDAAIALISSNMYSSKINLADLTIAALLHDLGKAGSFGMEYYVPNILKSGKISAAKPYETEKGLAGVQHQDTSIMILSRFINLNKDQYIAIKYHNGLYTADGRDIRGNETPLYLVIHMADMWASRVME